MASITDNDSMFDAAVAATRPTDDAPNGEGGGNLDAILSIPVTVQVVLGTTTMPVSRLMKLGRGGESDA